MSNRRYGKIKVLSKNEELSGKGEGTFWNCLCDCGTRFVCKASVLNAGHKRSCGCEKESIGESFIKNILDSNSINFAQEFSFSDLRGDRFPLRFDFAVFNKDNKLRYLIEYNGE